MHRIHLIVGLILLGFQTFCCFPSTDEWGIGPNQTKPDYDHLYPRFSHLFVVYNNFNPRLLKKCPHREKTIDLFGSRSVPWISKIRHMTRIRLGLHGPDWDSVHPACLYFYLSEGGILMECMLWGGGDEQLCMFSQLQIYVVGW